MHRRAVRSLAGVAVLSLALVACGQKPGVHVTDSNGGVAAPASTQGTDGAQEPVATGSGSVSAGADDGSTTTGATGTTGTTGGATAGSTGGGAASTTGSGSSSSNASTGATGGTAGSSGGGSSETTNSGGSDGSTQTQQSSGGQRQVSGSDRTGVTADKITFGLHAPVTGAAPLPSTSFEKSGDLYWRNFIDRQGGDVLGRTEVELIFRDDKYDPGSARQVCRELAEVSFTVAGGGGTDQIQACGAFANVAKFPYFSAGVTEAGLDDNAWYFASSMTYRQQGLLLADFTTTHEATAGKRTAAIITDTPNFDDAIQGWEQGVANAGIDYYKTLRHPKGDTSWYSAFARDLLDNGVEVVYILSSPVDYIRFAQKANEQGANFQYIGVGISMGLNAVLGSGCPDVDKGIFFSPFPGLDWARQNTPEFFEAGQDFGVPTDDIAFALWGVNETNHKLLQQYGEVYGPDLTREDYRDFVESAGIPQGVFNAVQYTPDNHFGSQGVHVLQADCSANGGDGEYVTIATFADSF